MTSLYDILNHSSSIYVIIAGITGLFARFTIIETVKALIMI